MKRPWWTLAIVTLFVSDPAVAQQGFVQVASGTLVATGAPERTGTNRAYQPDFGFSLFRPQTEFGSIQLDVHAVRNERDTGFGRALFAVRDLKAGGFTWKVDAGDSAHTPFVTDYGFSNLFAPQVTFRGTSVSAVGAKTSFDFTAGRVTVLRDVFGADAEALGQTLVVGRMTHRATARLELVAHASRVRTEDLKEFAYLIRSGDDAGAGLRLSLSRAWQISADAGVTSFVRRGGTTAKQQASALAGVRWTGTNGSFQVNAHRFPPGNFSVVNNSYNDREGLFATGEYNFWKRLRVDGGWDLFRTNLDPGDGPNGSTNPLSSGTRARAGFRLRVTSHLFVGGRVERGGRQTTPSLYSIGYESDTGSVSSEMQLTFSRWSTTVRYERRSNVDVNGTASTFAQNDVSAQLHFRASKRTQLFASTLFTGRRDAAGGAQSYWQVNGGAQLLIEQNLFVRSELTVSRNRDYQSELLTPRTALSAGVTGQISPRLSLAVDAYIDRSPIQGLNVSPFATRTLARLVYTLPTGRPVGLRSGRVVSPGRGSATVLGTAFVDWNGNGVQDPGEQALPEVTLVLDDVERVATDRNGSFAFARQAAGPHVLRVDVGTVPAVYDPPAATTVDVTVSRGERRTLSFAFQPVGDIEGTVFQDANGNGVQDEGDVPVEGAVIVLDDGTRTEVSRGGHFRFLGVRLGSHAVKILLESLGQEAAITGAGEVAVNVTQQQLVASTSFLVQAEKRPEIRKIFPPKK